MITSIFILMVLFFAIVFFTMTQKNVLAMIFVLFACFPYFKLFGIGTNTDIQIYTFVPASFIVLMNMLGGRKRVAIHRQAYSYLSYSIFLAILIMVVTVIRYIGSDYNLFYYIRGFIPYIAIILLPLATYISITKCGINSIEKLIMYAYYAWVFVGLIQIWFPNFMVEIRNRSIMGGGRGSASMAPEPAYFAMQLMMINFILYIIAPQKYKWLICPTALIVVLVAKSATGTFFVLCFFLMFYIKRKMVITLVFSLSVLSLLLLAFRHSLEQTRLIYLASQLFVDPRRIVVADGSLNSRFIEWIFSVKGFIDYFAMPRGVLGWSEYVYQQSNLYPELFFRRISGVSYWNKIASMLGALLFEAGVFAIPLLAFFAKFSKQGTGSYKPFLFILILSINALNYTNPMFNILLGLLIFRENIGLAVDGDSKI